MEATSINGKEKEISEIVPKKRQYLTRGRANKLMSNVMRENRVCTSIEKSLRKEKVMKEQAPEANIVDLSKEASENKRKIRVSLNWEVKRMRKGVIAEPVPKSDIRPSLKEKKEKLEMEFTRKEKMEVLRTQKVLSGRVFDTDVLPKPGICDLADVVELQSWTHMCVGYVPILHESK